MAPRMEMMRALGVAALAASSLVGANALEAAHEKAVERLGIEEGVANQMMLVLEQIQKNPPTPEALFALLFKAQDHPIDMATFSEGLKVERLMADLVLPTKSSTEWAADVETLAWNTVEHSQLSPEERAEALQLIQRTKKAGLEMADIIAEMMMIKDSLDSGRRSLDGESDDGGAELTDEEREQLKSRLRDLHKKLMSVQLSQKRPTERYFHLRKKYSHEGKDSLARYDAVDRVTQFFKDKLLAIFDPYL